MLSYIKDTIFAKAPWSWGRMHDILFVHSFGGRKIESRRQLRKREKPAREIEIGNETKKKARLQTTSDAGARSKNSKTRS